MIWYVLAAWVVGFVWGVAVSIFGMWLGRQR